jgi:hypothetical protein
VEKEMLILIIVKNRMKLKKYILLGTGLGAYKAVSPSFFGGNLFPKEEEGTIKTVAVCDANGDIFWFESDELQVVEVDGIKISEIGLSGPDEYDYCPACGAKLMKNEDSCHECGLVFNGR